MKTSLGLNIISFLLKNMDQFVSWRDFLLTEIEKDYFIKLSEFLEKESEQSNITPNVEDMFNVFSLCNFNDVKVCIIGQDPYPGKGVASGIAFSVKKNIEIPMSLQNIFKELKSDYFGKIKINHGDLTNWCKQGVFLINTCLSTIEGRPMAHSNRGWEEFVINALSRLLERVNCFLVILLWGKKACNIWKQVIEKSTIICRHVVLKAAHPSPLSANCGFFGCKHFSIANSFLSKNNIKEICWEIT